MSGLALLSGTLNISGPLIREELEITLDNRFPEVDELDEGLQLLKGDISQEDDRALLRIVVRQNVLKIIS